MCHQERLFDLYLLIAGFAILPANFVPAYPAPPPQPSFRWAKNGIFRPVKNLAASSRPTHMHINYSSSLQIWYFVGSYTFSVPTFFQHIPLYFSSSPFPYFLPNLDWLIFLPNPRRKGGGGSIENQTETRLDSLAIPENVLVFLGPILLYPIKCHLSS